jgi:hypothetical protein
MASWWGVIAAAALLLVQPPGGVAGDPSLTTAGVAVQRVAVARLIGMATPQEVACVWVAPPAGDVAGKPERDGGDAREPVAGFLERVPVTRRVALRPGSNCDAEQSGVREKGTNRSGLVVHVGRPVVEADHATVEGSAYCGGKCYWEFRFRLLRQSGGEWTVESEELLFQS